MTPDRSKVCQLKRGGGFSLIHAKYTSFFPPPDFLEKSRQKERRWEKDNNDN